MSTILCTILNIIFIAYCTIRTIYTVQYCALYFCCIVHIARIARIVLRVRILYILYTIVRYCVQNCTLSGPSWRGARLLPRRLAGLIPLLVLLRPIPAAAPRRFSSNALPHQITTARFTFQNHRCDDLRRRAQGSWPPPAAAAQAANARPSSAVELRKAWT